MPDLFVSVNLPGRPEGDEVEVPGLGVVANGNLLVVNDNEQVLFQAFHGRSLSEAFEESPIVSVSKDDPRKTEEDIKAGPKPRATAKKTSGQTEEVN